MARIKATKRGNVRLTMSRDEATAVYNAITTMDRDRFDSDTQWREARQVDRLIAGVII